MKKKNKKKGKKVLTKSKKIHKKLKSKKTSKKVSAKGGSAFGGKKLSASERKAESLTRISNELIEKGRKRGFITYDEILKTFPDIENNIFFLDETSFHLNMAPRRGYYWKDARLVYQRPGDKGKNQTLIFLTQINDGGKIIH